MRYIINGYYYNGQEYGDSFTDIVELAQCLFDINQIEIDFMKTSYNNDLLYEQKRHTVVSSETLVITTETAGRGQVINV